ncbi:DUF5017 domain-containing protein [Pedobacter sp.]
MKKFLNRYITGLALAICFLGCEKMEVSDVDFDVILQTGTYKAGDSVRFSLSGNPDHISFYSGKPGNNYDAIATQVLDNKVTFSFDSRMSNAGQANQLQVLTSTNFSGTNNIDAVKAANWEDLTSKFTLPGVSTTFSPSGSADITSTIKNHQPFYIAIKYTVKPFAESGAWAKWELNNFLYKITNSKEEKTPLDLNLQTSWAAVLSANYETFRVSIGTAGIVFQGNATNVAENHEAWFVSKVTYPYTSTSYAPDKAVAIKIVPQPARTSYAAAYDTPGSYQVVFVAKNVKGNQEKELVKRLTVKIEP